MSGTPMSMRDRTRRAVQDDISASAMRLFLANGFDSVSVEQIAQAVGISPRTFYRHFGTKEDVVLRQLGDYGFEIRAALVARPETESPWQALRASFDVLLDHTREHPEAARRTSRMLLETESLRARHLEKQLQWQSLLVPEVARRLSRSMLVPDARAAALVAAALSCLDAANAAWALTDAPTDIGAILDAAVDAVRSR